MTYHATAWKQTPFAEVIRGMEHVEGIYTGYGDKPDQGKLHSSGESYARQEFPLMDWIKKCQVVKRKGGGRGAGNIEDLEM